MIYSLAPMEGITGHAFRLVHAECFGALDRYYTPFLPPPRVGSPFGGKNLKEVDPANNQGLNVVPQLLTKNADEFVWAARELAELGYREVNLNLGCPSGTVVSKGKGAGFLRNLDELEVFLRDVCERSPIPVSVKTRLGLESDTEYEHIFELYCSLPLAELIVHRVCRRIATRANRAGSRMARRSPVPRSQWPTTATSSAWRTWTACLKRTRGPVT